MGVSRMATFQSKLSALVSDQLCGDANAIALAIERLTDSLGLAIAVSARGDAGQADTLINGVDGYLVECVAGHARLAAFMDAMGAHRKASPSPTQGSE